MALPPSIQTVLVTFGPFLDFQGLPLAGSTRIEPSTPVNHAATGTPILNRPISITWDEDGRGLIVLPATDSVGLDVTGFTYRVRHAFSDSNVPAPAASSIQLPAAVPTVDLDLLIPVPASNGVVVSVPGVVSVAGLTGTVTLEQLAAAGVGGSPANGSITPAKLSFDPATQAELDAVAGTIKSPAQLAADSTLRAALVPFWTANEALLAGAIRVAPDGTTIQRTANGTARSSYDGTEAALWIVRSGAGIFVAGLSASADNTATIQAALDAAKGGSPGGGGQVRLPRGVWPIAGRLSITNGQRLTGESGGGSGGYGGTALACTAVGAGVDIIGDGGGLSFLEIDGADVANYPLHEGTGADRMFLSVDVHDALLDNWVQEFVQNSNYIGCTSNRSGRDAIVFDKECGGSVFTRLGVSDPGRYGISIKQSVTPTTAYTTPSHLRFDHCLIERPVGNYPLVDISAAFNVDFETCILSGANVQTSAALMRLAGVSFVSVDGCQFSGTNVTNQVAIAVGSGCHLSIDGTVWLINVPFFLDNPSGTVQMNGGVFLNGAAFVTAATPSSGDQNVQKVVRAAMSAQKTGTGGVVMSGQVTTESGQRWRLYADGRYSIGDGTGYTFPTSLYRRGDGKWGTDGGMVIGGQLKMTDAVPITTVSATGTITGGAAFGAVHSTAATAITLTVPPNSTEPFFGTGTVIEVVQMAAGQVTIAAGAGVTIRTAASLTTRTQYSSLSLRKIGTDEWLLTGDLT